MTIDPCAHVTVSGTDGATLAACAYGGQLLAWTPAGRTHPDGDRLWLSPLAQCGDGAAIRGGVPVIFPQFSARGPLPKHGFARDRTWQLETGRDESGAATVDAELSSDEATLAIWPHPFRLRLACRAAGAELTVTLTVHNDGEAPFSATAALHAYLRVRSADPLITGLESAWGEDNARGRAAVQLPAEPLHALAERDVAVPGLAGRVELLDGDQGLTIGRAGFDDLVVWNPGPGHQLADVPRGGDPAHGAAGFVCIEPAQLTPVTVRPGASWQARVAIVAS